MRRTALLTAGGIALLALAVQLLLPPFVESRVEDRLERDGGSAEADLDAFPAPRLLWRDGERIEIRGSGYELELDEPGADAFDEVDGFDEVDVSVDDFRVGPFDVAHFELTRARARDDYAMSMSGGANAGDLAVFAGREIGGTLGGLLGALGGQALPEGARERVVFADLSATLGSDEGRVYAKEAEGSVAGIPAGPLAEVVASAIVERLQ
jgi:hypothetical protein